MPYAEVLKFNEHPKGYGLPCYSIKTKEPNKYNSIFNNKIFLKGIRYRKDVK